MAELHHDATITPSKQDLVAGWIGRQRWYAAKGRTPSIRRVRSFRFDDPAGVVGVETMLVLDSAGDDPVLYQVPLTYRDAPLEGADEALVGITQHSVLGTRWVYDGPHDPVYAALLLAAMQGRARVTSATESDTFDDSVRGVRHPTWVAVAEFVGSHVLRGEQSNTSVVIDARLADGSVKPLICKVFRTLQAGANPDVELQGALVEAGCRRVPAVVGHLTGAWPAGDGDPQEGDLAIGQEFLPGVEDAWRVARRAVAEGAEFTERAHELGAATAEVHHVLAEALGSCPTRPADARATVAQMRARRDAALAEVPALAAYGVAVEAVLAATEGASWPALQRIHGDYHLGQVLRSPERGWVLLDFEGEPLRPLAERRQPDHWLRDLAGMLRSFDYAGGAHEHAVHGASARAWVEDCRAAFLDGYAATAGDDPRSHGSLLTAFELDKAFYEVVYEARNRPTWMSIPLTAIERLLAEGTQTIRPRSTQEGTP